MQVQHDPDNGKFHISDPDGETYLDYQEEDDNTLIFSYVYSPPACRGKGHAAKVLIAAFEWAAGRNARVIPTCPYIAHTFIPRFPEYQKLVDRDG